MEKEITKKLDHCLLLVKKRRQIELPKPRIIVASQEVMLLNYPMSKRVAGLANSGNNTIYLSAEFLATHFNEMLNSTLPHEVCHLLTYFQYGEKSIYIDHNGHINSHTRLWANNMKEVFGLFPHPFHIMGHEKIWELEK